MTVAKRIKLYLNEKGISQTWLSQETKIPLPKLNLALNGKRKLTMDEFELIIIVLGVSSDTFIAKSSCA